MEDTQHLRLILPFDNVKDIMLRKISLNNLTEIYNNYKNELFNGIFDRKTLFLLIKDLIEGLFHIPLIEEFSRTKKQKYIILQAFE